MRILTTRRMMIGGLVAAATLAIQAEMVRAQRPGVVERAGRALDNAGRAVRDGVENAFERTREAVNRQEVIDRVYSRLHWDRVLVGSTLELQVVDESTVILRGAVTDENAKRRALILARDTVGVVQVVDELGIMPESRTIVTPPIDPEVFPADPQPLPVDPPARVIKP